MGKTCFHSGPCLFLPKKHPNLGAFWSNIATHIFMPHSNIQDIPSKIHIPLYTRIALFVGAQRDSYTTIFRVNLTLDLSLAAGQIERFVRRGPVTLSVRIVTNSGARANCKHQV